MNKTVTPRLLASSSPSKPSIKERLARARKLRAAMTQASFESFEIDAFKRAGRSGKN